MMSDQELAFKIDADHYQFYLEDEMERPAYGELWSQLAHRDRIDVLPGLIAVGTGRYGPNIQIAIEVRQTPPHDESFDQWDHVVECAITIRSGHVALTSPISYGTEGPKIDVKPGTYRVRVHYGNLNSVRGVGDMEGDDHYRIVLWPDSYIKPQVLKCMQLP